MIQDKQKPLVERFHKATVLLAENLVGEASTNFATFPFVAKLPDGNHALFLPAADPRKADYDYLHAFIVNAGLTLELKLKHLHKLEGGSAPRGHNLLDLFNKLKSDTRTFLINNVKSQVEQSIAHESIVAAARDELSIDVSWDADFLLEKSSYAFEKWRYVYEEQSKGSWFCGYIELYKALEDRIASA